MGQLSNLSITPAVDFRQAVATPTCEDNVLTHRDGTGGINTRSWNILILQFVGPASHNRFCLKCPLEQSHSISLTHSAQLPLRLCIHSHISAVQRYGLNADRCNGGTILNGPCTIIHAPVPLRQREHIAAIPAQDFGFAAGPLIAADTGPSSLISVIVIAHIADTIFIRQHVIAAKGHKGLHGGSSELTKLTCRAIPEKQCSAVSVFI